MGTLVSYVEPMGTLVSYVSCSRGYRTTGIPGTVYPGYSGDSISN